MTGQPPITEDDLIRFHAGAVSGADRDALAARIAADPAARVLLDIWRTQDAELSAAYADALDEALPVSMTEALAEAKAEERASTRSRMALPLRAAAALALLAVGAAGGYYAGQSPTQGQTPARFAREAMTAYTTYVSEVVHPVEVEADQADHLTQWLSKRLGHPIKAPDFASAGFHLIGGRLLPSETGPAALFMYEDDLGRRVTLYAAPGVGTGDTAFRFIEEGTTQGFYWIDGTLSYAVAGDLPRDALRAIAVAAYDQLT